MGLWLRLVALLFGIPLTVYTRLNDDASGGGRHKYPVIETTVRFNGRGIQFNRHGMIPSDCFLSPIGPVKGLGFDFF
jgi:hypothetical protein